MLWSPWELRALPSKAHPLFWGRTELHLSGGVSPSKSQQPEHCSHRNLLCNQTPVISKAMSPRSPAIPTNPGLRWSCPTSHSHVGTSVSFFLYFIQLVSRRPRGARDSVPHTQHNVQHAPTAPSTAGFSNLHWHRKLGLFCYYFVYLFSLRRRHRQIRSVCSKTRVFVRLFW